MISRGIILNNKKTKPMVILIICTLLISVFLAGCIIPTEYMVEMRDGVHLATDVYLPTGQSQPHGTILIRTPYNKIHLAFLVRLGQGADGLQ